jgi:acyl-CoA thioester hydrolase
VPRVFRHRLRIRYGECDPQGVVFNANYLAFFDVIITEFWREAIGDYNAMIEDGADMVTRSSTSSCASRGWGTRRSGR